MMTFVELCTRVSTFFNSPRVRFWLSSMISVESFIFVPRRNTWLIVVIHVSLFTIGGLFSRYNANLSSTPISASASSNGVMYFDSFSSSVPGVAPSLRSSTGLNVYTSGFSSNAAQVTASVVLHVQLSALTIVICFDRILLTYSRCSSVSLYANPNNRLSSGSPIMNRLLFEYIEEYFKYRN